MFKPCLNRINEMASVKAVLYKSKKKADGRFLVGVRVTVNRKTKYNFVDWIFEKDWDNKNAKVKSSHPNSQRLNNLIRKKIVEADDLILEAEAQNKNYSSVEISEGLSRKGSKASFNVLAEEHLLNLTATGHHNRKSSEQGMLNSIKAFNDENDVAFHQIDEAYLNKLKGYLMGYKGVSERTVANYFIFIRTMFNKAIANGIVDAKYYPFGKGKVRIKFPESIKVGLDQKEIIALETLELRTGSPQWHARNVFLFSFYLAGIRVSDVLRTKWKDIVDGRLYYVMGKNNKVVSLKVPEKAIQVVLLYKEEGSKTTDYIFPELKKADVADSKDVHAKIRTATRKFNKYLKQIGEELKIEKKITTHIARHSFGNIAAERISSEELQKLYRHSSVQTTKGYQGNFIHKDADEALNSVVQF